MGAWRHWLQRVADRAAEHQPLRANVRGPEQLAAGPGGKLTRSLETDELKAAVGFARDAWAAGFYHPNSLTYTNVSSRGDLIAGRFAMLDGAWANYSGWWQMGAANDPPTQIRPQLPLSLGGGKPVYWLGVGNFGVTALKNASAERVKELLAVLNYLAAPFGSEEGLVLDYGVEGPTSRGTARATRCRPSRARQRS